MPAAAPAAPLPPPQAAAVRAVEEVYAAYFAFHEGVPEVEVHSDPDVCWLLTPGVAWSNCAVRLRFAAATAGGRLDQLLRRYQEHGRGAGFWVSPIATPAEIERRLHERGLRCRKRFPAMHADLAVLPEVEAPAVAVGFDCLADASAFDHHPHPYYGAITTARRRFALRCQELLAKRRPQRLWQIVAHDHGTPLGSCTLFRHGDVVGLFDVGVVESSRRQGIGTALVAHACRFARQLGCQGAILIAAGMGEGVYRAAGFREVARIAYWYTAHPSPAAPLASRRAV